MSCKLDVVGGLAEVKQSVELQLAVSKYGKVECLFLPPPDLRHFEPGLVIFEESQSVQEVVKACGEGKVAVRGQPLYCEPHKPGGAVGEAAGGNWGRGRELPAYAANSKKRKLPPQHQVDSRSYTHRDVPREGRPGEVGMCLIGELGEEKSGGPQRIIRFIKCKDLPKYMKMMDLDVFIVRANMPKLRRLPPGTKVSFILKEQSGTGKPQTDGEDVEEVTWQKSHGTGTGPPRGRQVRVKQGARKEGRDDPRLERFIELNHLDDDAEVCKSLRRSNKSLQAAVIDHWEEAGLKIDQSEDRRIDAGAVVMAKLRAEQERIREETQATTRSTSRRRSLGDEEDNDDERRSRSRSSARRSRSQESASRSPSQQGADNDGVTGSAGVTDGAAESTHEAHQQKQSRPSRTRSRSRGSASRSLTPLKRDSALQTRESQEQDEPTGSLLLQLTNLPSLNKGTAVSGYLADMLAPHLRELPDFDSSLGNPILQAWEHGHDNVFMKLQSAVLAASAARVVDGLPLFGSVVKVRNLSKSEADHAQGTDEPRRQQQQQAIQDSMPTRKVMLRAAA